MLEIGKPPSWLPVQISTDPRARSITIQTFDGHVLRGTQTFSFKDNGDRGTQITQDAHFQAGSKVVGDAQQFLSISRGQHEAWQSAHRESYEQFNCNPGYAGQGIRFDPAGQAVAIGGEVIDNVRTDPGGVLNAGIDLGGDLLNLGADAIGKVVGGSIGRTLDQAGDHTEGTLDRVGDVAESGFKAVGQILGFGTQAAEKVAHNGLDFLRDKVGDGLHAVAAHTPVGTLVDKLPWKNSLKAAIQELPPFSRDQITLEDNAIELIKKDPAFMAHQEEILAAIKKDPRYGKESIPLSDLPIEQYVEFGGQSGSSNKLHQLTHAWDLSDPNVLSFGG